MKKILLLTTILGLLMTALPVNGQTTEWCFNVPSDQSSRCFSTREACKNGLDAVQSGHRGSLDGEGPCVEQGGSTTVVDTTQQPSEYVPLATLPGLQEEENVDISNYFQNIFNLLIGIAAVLAVVMIIVGGIQYMSTDAVSGKSEGRDRITKAVYGLILAIASWLILFTINPAILNFDIAKVDRAETPIRQYSSLDNAPDGFYAPYRVVSPFGRDKYGPYTTLDACNRGVSTTVIGDQKVTFHGCLSEFEDQEIYETITNNNSARPGSYVEFELLKNTGFQAYGPFYDESVCRTYRRTPVNETVNGEPLFYNTPSCDPNDDLTSCACGLINEYETSDRASYESISDIELPGYYKQYQKTSGRELQTLYWGPYFKEESCNISNEPADANFRLGCTFYGIRESVRAHDPNNQNRPAGFYKTIGVFRVEGFNYFGRFESETECQSATPSDVNQVINQDDLDDYEITHYFKSLFGLFNEPSAISNFECTSKSGTPEKGWYAPNNFSEKGAFRDYTHYFTKDETTVFYGPYTDSDTCAIKRPRVDSGETLNSKLVVNSLGCTLKQE